MNAPISESLLSRLQTVDTYLLQVCEDLSDEQLSRRPGPAAPPIGWHMWHITRWADRFQASFSRPGAEIGKAFHPDAEIWQVERLAACWGLDPSTLGLLQTGAGMGADAASALPQAIGRSALFEYARRIFTAGEQALAELNPEQLTASRISISEFETVGTTVREAPGKPTTHIVDILFHLTHANRHLGMIEALRGWLGMRGSASV